MLQNFNVFYRFGTLIKQKAALYGFAILFTLCVTNWLLGVHTLLISHVIQAFLVSFIVAVIEYVLFYHYDELTPSTRTKHTLIWLLCCNILFMGSAYLFNWYRGVPRWGIFILIFLLESGLVALRYSIYVMNEFETKQLNEGLKKFKKNS